MEMADPPINLTFDHLHDEEEDDHDEEEDDDLDDEEEDDDLDDEENKLENFRKDMPINTSFERPMSKYRLWAFWSEPTPLSRCSSGDSVTHTSNTNQGMITEKIKSALLHFNNIFQQGHVLIQFWAPMRTETGCLELVTSDQPFALTKHLDERLLKYRKHCLEYKFNVDGSQQHLGIPGRVFRQKWHECISDVRDYTSKEYPQRNFALTCDISASFAFPVFQTSFQDCVGVIEFVTNTDSTTLDIMCYSFLQDVLKTAGLKSSLSYLLISRIHEEHLNEICEGVKVVCTTHRLPLAHTSVPYKHFYEGSMDNSSDMFDVNSILRLQWPKSYIGNQKQNKDRAKPPQAPKDYIHVRARRVQATDSHSLAERVRREKISERMKCLQDLVPGCKKVTRKVLLLDEVINNTQSLQRQVEFLSYKLATIHPRMDINIEAILSKDICQSHGAMPHNIYPSDTSATAFPYGYQSQQGPQLHSGISNGTETPFSMNPLNAPLCRNPSMQLPPIDGFGDIASQSTCTKKYDYIPDSFPNPENTYGEDPSTFWRSLLETMKQHFPSFKNASGEELRKELSIEFIKPSMNQEFASLHCQSTRSPSGPAVLHNGQEMMQPHSLNEQLIIGVDDINNEMNVVNAGQNSILVSCSDESFMNHQSTRSPSGLAVFNNGQEIMQPHSSNQQLMVGVDDINNGRKVINAERNNILVSCSDEICMNQEFASLQCQSTISPSGFAVLHNEQEMMQLHSSNQQLIVGVNDINNGRNVINAKQNSILVSCSDETCKNVPASFQCQSTISPPGPGVLHNGQETMQPHSSNHQLIVEVDDISNGRTERNNTPISYLDEANSITYVELKKHFGKKIEDVAEIFGVSRSTIKRKCRENGISRWPQGKRNKINNSLSRQDPSCSAKKLGATVPQKTPLVTPPTPPQVRTITVKATCGDDVLKFQLPSSSTMVELEEEVSKRLKYVGTYKVKYTDNDGDQVLIACDKDLENCMSTSNSLGMNRVEMIIVPITKISPST